MRTSPEPLNSGPIESAVNKLIGQNVSASRGYLHLEVTNTVYPSFRIPLLPQEVLLRSTVDLGYPPMLGSCERGVAIY